MAKEFAKKFYKSKEWIKCRDYIFKKYHGICQECGRPGEEVHHKEFLNAININYPNIALGEDNLILLCRDCHFEKHKKTNPLERNFNKSKPITNNGTYFDENGELKEIKKYIVYGAPGAGKTTYVNKHRQYGDLVVDLDLIKQAISMEGKTNAPDNLLSVANAIRETIYREIEANKVDCKNIWIIASLPYKNERIILSKRLKAELVFINTDILSCIDNAMNDDSRSDKQLQKYIINKWFEVYEQ